MIHDPYNLRVLVMQHNTSASKLASILGIHRSTVYKHLDGKAAFTSTTLCKLADYFGVTTDYILGREKHDVGSNTRRE